MWIIWRNEDLRFGIGFSVKNDEVYEMWTSPDDPTACLQCAWLNGGGTNVEAQDLGLLPGRGRVKIPPIEEPAGKGHFFFNFSGDVGGPKTRFTK